MQRKALNQQLIDDIRQTLYRENTPTDLKLHIIINIEDEIKNTPQKDRLSQHQCQRKLGESVANDKGRGEELWWKEEGPSMSTKMSPRLWANDGFRIITDIIAIDVDMEEELLIINDTAVTAQGESYVIFLSFSF